MTGLRHSPLPDTAPSYQIISLAIGTFVASERGVAEARTLGLAIPLFL
jgi:hypothetical protein